MSERSEASMDSDEELLSSEEPSAVERWQESLQEVSVPRAVRASSRQSGERPRTVQQAAEELGLSVHTIRAWVADRRLAHLRLGRAIRIPADEIRRVLLESTIPRSQGR
jgi:excisionase family DNA binding protein